MSMVQASFQAKQNDKTKGLDLDIINKSVLMRHVLGGYDVAISAKAPAELRAKYDALLSRLSDNVEVTDKNRAELSGALQKKLGLKDDGVPGRMTIYGAELAEKAGGITPEVKAGIQKFEGWLRYGREARTNKIGIFTSLHTNELGEVEIKLPRSEDGQHYTINGDPSKIEMGQPGKTSKMEDIIASTEINHSGKAIQYSKKDPYPTIDGGITDLRLPVGDGQKSKSFTVNQMIAAGVVLDIEGTKIDFAKFRDKNADIGALEKYKLLQMKIGQKLEDASGKYGEKTFKELPEEFQESLLSFNYNVGVDRTGKHVVNAVKAQDSKALANALDDYTKANGSELADLKFRRKLDIALLRGQDDTVAALMVNKQIYTDRIEQNRKNDPQYVQAILDVGGNTTVSNDPAVIAQNNANAAANAAGIQSKGMKLPETEAVTSQATPPVAPAASVAAAAPKPVPKAEEAKKVTVETAPATVASVNSQRIFRNPTDISNWKPQEQPKTQEPLVAAKAEEPSEKAPAKTVAPQEKPGEAVVAAKSPSPQPEKAKDPVVAEKAAKPAEEPAKPEGEAAAAAVAAAPKWKRTFRNPTDISNWKPKEKKAEAEPEAKEPVVAARKGSEEVRSPLDLKGCEESLKLLQAAHIEGSKVITPGNAKDAKQEISAFQHALNSVGYSAVKVNGLLDQETIKATESFRERTGGVSHNSKAVVIDSELVQKMKQFLSGGERYASGADSEQKKSQPAPEQKTLPQDKEKSIPPEREKDRVAENTKDKMQEALAGIVNSGSVMADSRHKSSDVNFKKSNIPVISTSEKSIA